jgi:hypothetical protein
VKKVDGYHLSESEREIGEGMSAVVDVFDVERKVGRRGYERSKRWI